LPTTISDAEDLLKTVQTVQKAQDNSKKPELKINTADVAKSIWDGEQTVIDEKLKDFPGLKKLYSIFKDFDKSNDKIKFLQENNEKIKDIKLTK
jgi:hypothetical protein